ncbi:hypothetical protein ACO2Q1_08885 [Brevundimonas sp. VNH65]|uniref:hypothetical protein n=1 Tax=Brevundimonas sp. VNH65 TaxID=3400917 RepID=UPI003C06D634
MSKPWVVVCGMIRDAAVFATKLETLRAWKADGVIEDVVLSTWAGEIDRYPEVGEAWSRGEFILVETDPPILKTVGHTVHQARSLYYGLQAVPEGVKVLKTRPDLGDLTGPVRAILEQIDLTLTPKAGWPEVFGSKIAVVMHSLEIPFYVNDIIYFGVREDLLRLANFDLSTEYLCSHMAPEQFFFRGAFAGQFPLLEAYFQVAPPLVFNDAVDGQARQDILLQSDVFLDAVALNTRLMNHYFRIGFVADEQRRAQGPLPEGFDLRAMFGPSQTPGVRFYEPIHSSNVFEERAGAAILERRFAMDDLGARMAEALDRTEDPAYWRSYSANPLNPSDSIRALQRSIADRFPNTGHRLVEEDAGSRRRRIKLSGERISLMVDTQEGVRLSEEVNFLRRLVNDLQGGRPISPERLAAASGPVDAIVQSDFADEPDAPSAPDVAATDDRVLNQPGGDVAVSEAAAVSPVDVVEDGGPQESAVSSSGTGQAPEATGAAAPTGFTKTLERLLGRGSAQS